MAGDPGGDRSCRGTYKLGNGVQRLCRAIVPDGICCRFMRRKADVVSCAKETARLLPRENATMRLHQMFEVVPAKGLWKKTAYTEW